LKNEYFFNQSGIEGTIEYEDFEGLTFVRVGFTRNNTLMNRKKNDEGVEQGIQKKERPSLASY
jgi:hypothetical protein